MNVIVIVIFEINVLVLCFGNALLRLFLDHFNFKPWSSSPHSSSRKISSVSTFYVYINQAK